MQFWIRKAATAATDPDPVLPNSKVFKAKFDLPPVFNYQATPAPEFWR
jgi:hypothetical protein